MNVDYAAIATSIVALKQTVHPPARIDSPPIPIAILPANMSGEAPVQAPGGVLPANPGLMPVSSFPDVPTVPAVLTFPHEQEIFAYVQGLDSPVNHPATPTDGHRTLFQPPELPLPLIQPDDRHIAPFYTENNLRSFSHNSLTPPETLRSPSEVPVFMQLSNQEEHHFPSLDRITDQPGCPFFMTSNRVSSIDLQAVEKFFPK